jgi:hypothetical protein
MGMVATGRAGCPQVRPTAWARFDEGDDTYHPAFAVRVFTNLTQLPESTFMVTKSSFSLLLASYTAWRSFAMALSVYSSYLA